MTPAMKLSSLALILTSATTVVSAGTQIAPGLPLATDSAGYSDDFLVTGEKTKADPPLAVVGTLVDVTRQAVTGSAKKPLLLGNGKPVKY